MIPLFKVFMPESVDRPLLDVLHSGQVTQGAKVDEFERLLAARLGTSHIVTLNNCTSAIQLALRLAGVGPGTSVVSTPMTCTASNMPVLAQGADLIWADIDPHTGVIDPESVLKRIRPDTKAVIAVAWGGYPPALDELDALCSEYGVALIQDNAQAFGAEYHGRPVHEWGDFACYSFQAIKHLTTIDGGMLICRDADAYRRARLLRWYGIDRDDKRQDARIENDIPEFGYKWHMNDVAATIGIEQLKYIDDILARHRANAAYYNEEFGRRDLFRAQPAEHGDSGRTPAYWLYTVLVDDPHGFRQHMADRGIQVSPAHKRNDKHSCFADAVGCPLPGVDEFSAHEMCVPVGWWVSDDDRRQIMNAIEEWDYVEEAVSER